MCTRWGQHSHQLLNGVERLGRGEGHGTVLFNVPQIGGERGVVVRIKPRPAGAPFVVVGERPAQPLDVGLFDLHLEVGEVALRHLELLLVVHAIVEHVVLVEAEDLGDDPAGKSSLSSQDKALTILFFT